MVSNYLFPLPFPAHLTFCIIGVIFFGLMYWRNRYTYHLLLTFAIPSTLLIYVCKTELAFNILAIEELVLFAIIVISIFLSKKRKAKEEEEAVKLASNPESDED